MMKDENNPADFNKSRNNPGNQGKSRNIANENKPNNPDRTQAKPDESKQGYAARSPKITDETQPEDFHKTPSEEYKNIKGWGIDKNRDNDPTYPIKNRTDDEQEGYTWERPAQQPETVEVLHSVERPNVTATFGTSVPPSGLSGVLRRLAFKYSESHYAHWLPLVMADRIGVIEGILKDLSMGHIPNIFIEQGWKAQWKYDRKTVVTKVVTVVAVATATVILFKLIKNKRYRGLIATGAKMLI